MMEQDHPIRYASTSRGDPYPCTKPWPADCSIQCGASGVVLSSKGSYRTAFFEAFPLETFIRGQGATVQEAEEAAWEKYQAQLNCPEHSFSRKGESEHGVCTLCSYNRLYVFKPVHNCHVCSKPEVNLEFFGGYFCIEHYAQVARKPEAYASLLRDKESLDGTSSLLTEAESYAGYRVTAWDYDVLVEHGLVNESVEEHQISRFLFDAHSGIRLEHARRVFLSAMYKEWIEQHPTRPVGALMMSTIQEAVYSDEKLCKLAVVASLSKAKLISVHLSGADWSYARQLIFAQFAISADEFDMQRKLYENSDKSRIGE